MKLAPHLESLRRAFRWHRRLFAAIFAAVAVLAALSAINAGNQPGRVAVITARSIAGGAVVQAADVELAPVPDGLSPPETIAEVDAVIGQRAAAPIPARRVLTPGDLVGSAGQLEDGKLALPVTFADSAGLSLLRTGTRIDVLGASGDSGFAVLASDVRVVTVAAAEDQGMLSSGQAGPVLIEVTSEQARVIAAAASVSGLSFALR